VRGFAPVSLRKISAGIILFVLLTAGGYAAVRWSAGPQSESVLSAVSGAKRSFLLLTLGLVALEFSLIGARFWVLARAVQPGFRMRDGIHVGFYLMFAAGVTPMQLGAGPAQYFGLRRKGLNAHDVLAVLSLNWLSSLIALVTLAGLGLWYLILEGNLALGGLLQGLMAMLGITALAAVAVTLFPRQITRVLVGFRALRRSRRGHRMLRSIARYRGALREFRRTPRGRRAWVSNILVSLTALLVRCLIGVAVLATLGIDPNAISAIARQALQFAVMTAAPSPGGSGVAEVTTIGLMSGLVPTTLILSYTVLWRFFTAYAGIAAGAIQVFVDVLRSTTGIVGDTASDQAS
jgi:uncharacterized protein (TIRG00374 family)